MRVFLLMILIAVPACTPLQGVGAAVGVGEDAWARAMALVDAGVARSRSHALAWCVRLVGDHEGEWIDQLRDALVHVEKVRDGGPKH